jgi:hypothetical protein
VSLWVGKTVFFFDLEDMVPGDHLLRRIITKTISGRGTMLMPRHISPTVCS